jgi:hypothetical protein
LILCVSYDQLPNENGALKVVRFEISPRVKAKIGCKSSFRDEVDPLSYDMGSIGKNAVRPFIIAIAGFGDRPQGRGNPVGLFDPARAKRKFGARGPPTAAQCIKGHNLNADNRPPRGVAWRVRAAVVWHFSGTPHDDRKRLGVIVDRVVLARHPARSRCFRRPATARERRLNPCDDRARAWLLQRTLLAILHNSSRSSRDGHGAGMHSSKQRPTLKLSPTSRFWSRRVADTVLNDDDEDASTSQRGFS